MRDLKWRLNYVWRVAATGACFVLFSCGGLLLTLLAIPPLRLLRDRRQRAARARWLIHKAFALFMWQLQALGLARFSVEGRERLQNCRNMLVLANHPTLVDVVAMISLMPSASCVVKEALFRSPFVGGVVRAADYISNSTPEILIQDCAADLKAGHPLVIFPEGTRTQPGQPLHFLRGAAYIALHARQPILPVLIYCDPPTLTKCKKWYQIPHRPVELRVKILPPIPLESWHVPADAPAIAARRLTAALENYFTEQLEHHGRIEAGNQAAHRRRPGS